MCVSQKTLVASEPIIMLCLHKYISLSNIVNHKSIKKVKTGNLFLWELLGDHFLNHVHQNAIVALLKKDRMN